MTVVAGMHFFHCGRIYTRSYGIATVVQQANCRNDLEHFPLDISILIHWRDTVPVARQSSMPDKERGDERHA